MVGHSPLLEQSAVNVRRRVEGTVRYMRVVSENIQLPMSFFCVRGGGRVSNGYASVDVLPTEYGTVQ